MNFPHHFVSPPRIESIKWRCSFTSFSYRLCKRGSNGGVGITIQRAYSIGLVAITPSLSRPKTCVDTDAQGLRLAGRVFDVLDAVQPRRIGAFGNGFAVGSHRWLVVSGWRLAVSCQRRSFWRKNRPPTTNHQPPVLKHVL